MALVQMVMPKMGESITEGTILNWLKKPGDRIAQDENVLEVATDKVDTEVPSTHAGVLKEVFVNVGDVVAVGSVIATIDTGGDSVAASAPAPAPVVQQEVVAPIVAAVPVVATSNEEEAPLDGPFALLAEAAPGRFYSPLVMNMVKEEKISMSELERIPGTGKDNRVTKRDMVAFIEWKKTNKTSTTAPAPAVAVPATVVAAPVQAAQPIVTQQPAQVAVPPVQTPVQQITPPAAVVSEPAPQVVKAQSFSGPTDIIEMDRMRKMIAQRMVDSVRISPHVTSFVEADVTNIVYWRNRVKNDFKAKEGDAITFTPIFLEAVAKALKDFPMMNVSVDGDKIIVKKYINLGMAVALPSGNLIVPVIKNADQLNLVGLTKRVNDLARRARENKLTPDDLSDGTFTVSNVGSFGNVMGTPIILQPQVGIVALGAIQKKPAVIETPTGDSIGIRHLMFLSHSYDHRVVDGSLGGMFIRRVADYLEAFDLNRKL